MRRNTYFFAKGETDRKILTDLYQRQMKSLDDAWNNRAADLPYKNKYEALIMASIIEKETNVDAELEQVSGVFVRRLKLGMRLQTDPTVIYGMVTVIRAISPVRIYALQRHTTPIP